MNKQSLESLAKFCAKQRRAFSPRAWLQRSLQDGKALAIAAMYLSMTGWYGHENDLKKIISTVPGGIAGPSEFHIELNAIEFDLGLFSARVRYEMATQDRQFEELDHQPLT